MAFTYIAAAAALQKLSIPAECEAGVMANMDLFIGHADIVTAAGDPMAGPTELLQL